MFIINKPFFKNTSLIILILVVIAILAGSFRFAETYYDSKFMIQTSNYIKGTPETYFVSGQDTTLVSPTAVRVLVPFFALLLNPIMSLENAFATVNIIFWIFTITIYSINFWYLCTTS